MEYYSYIAIENKTGKKIKGRMLSENEIEINEYLRILDLTVVNIKKIKEIKFLENFLLRYFRTIKLKDKIFLMRNLSLILKSGAGLSRGLRMLSKTLKYSSLKEFVLFMIYNVEKGGHLYESFSYFKNSFTPIEVEVIKISETSGNLINAFDKLANDLQKEKEIRSEIISSLIYPSIILFASLVVITLVVTFVVPRLYNLVQQLDTPLPFYSKIILETGKFIGDNIKYFLIAIFLFLILFISLILSDRGKKIIFLFLLKIPIIKNIILIMNLRSFCFVLGSLIKNGISISKSLSLTSNAINHPKLVEATLRVNNKIIQGFSFSESISQEEAFPSFFSGILAISSETGNLAEVLSILEKYYEDEFRFYVKNLMTVIEPLMIIFVGMVVVLIAISIVVPIYQQLSIQIQQSLQPGGGF
jgi:type II secretory pathway component PulF